MSEKKINTRVINKHDTESNWSKATGFIPKQGELIIYDKDSTHDYVRVKVGDGTTVVSSLPFIDDTKVDKVDGKQLSTEDYTTAEKTKLAGIAEGANKTVVDSALSSTSTNPVQNKVVNTAISNLNTLVGDTSVSSQISSAIANKVDKVSGKDLSTNDYTTNEKNKLAGIASGAEVNQNAFSNIVVGSTTIAADSKTDSLTLVAGSNVTITPDATNDKVTITATDTVYTHPSYTARTGVPTANATPAFGGTFNVSQPVSDATGHITAINSRTITIPNTAATTSTAGLMSAADKSKLDGIATGADKTTIDSALSSTSTNPVQNKVVNTAISNLNTLVGDTSVSSQITSAINALNLSGTYIAATQKGAANGLAELDSTGKVPSAQLPSYVDDVLEYSTKSSFPSTGETGKIYVDTTANLTYRWSGSAYVEISPSIALGTTSSTAFRGDYGNTAYTHATAKGSAFTSGLYKITTNAQGHVTAATAVAKSDITGLGIPAQDTTYSVATTSANGLMSSTDKSKLDGIAAGANKTVVDSSLSASSTNPVQNKVVNTAISNLNTLVGDTAVSTQITTATNSFIKGLSVSGKTITYTKGDGTTGTITTQDTNTTYSDMTGATSSAAGTHGLVPAPAAGKQTSFLRGDGTWVVPTNTTYSDMTGATSSAAGTHGLVPAPSAGAATRYLRSDGTWQVPPDTNTTYSAATTSSAGLMSAADKTKLNGIATGATKVTVDSALSSTSTNPVQNKVVNTAISNLNTLMGDTSVSSQISEAVTPKLDAADATWVQVYDSGAITSEVNSISSINVTGYKSLMVAVKCVNTTNTTSTRSGAVIFTGSNSQDYAFNNIFSNLLKNGTTTSGAFAKFKIVDGFIICENALRAITADGMLSGTEGEGIDTLAPVSGGLIKCTSTVTTMAVSSAAQSVEHYFGVGSRVIVWGCKV